MSERPAGYAYAAHTADVIVQAWGPGPGDALGQALLGVAALIQDPATVAAANVRRIELAAADGVGALVQAANELLFWFDTDGFMVSSVQVRELSTDPWRVRLDLVGDSLDERSGRYDPASPPKAATYHQADFAPDPGGKTWRVRLTLDV